MKLIRIQALVFIIVIFFSFNAHGATVVFDISISGMGYYEVYSNTTWKPYETYIQEAAEYLDASYFDVNFNGKLLIEDKLTDLPPYPEVGSGYRDGNFRLISYDIHSTYMHNSLVQIDSLDPSTIRPIMLKNSNASGFFHWCPDNSVWLDDMSFFGGGGSYVQNYIDSGWQAFYNTSYNNAGYVAGYGGPPIYFNDTHRMRLEFFSANITFDRYISSVPEPSTFLLFGAGLGGLALIRRRK